MAVRREISYLIRVILKHQLKDSENKVFDYYSLLDIIMYACNLIENWL